MLQLFSKEEILKWWLPSLAAVMFIVMGIILEENLLLVLPFVVLAAVVFSSDIRKLYFALLFVIPLSTEFSVTATLSTDLPDEPMMLLLSGSLIVIMVLKPSVFPSQIKKSNLFLLVLLQLTWMTVTMLFSYETFLSVKYILAKTWFITAFVIGGMIFLKTKEDFILASKALIFSMLIPVVISLTRHAFKGFTFESINETLTPFFRNHVNYSALIVCLLPVLFMWRHYSTGRSKKWVTACILLFFAALVFCLFKRSVVMLNHWYSNMAGNKKTISVIINFYRHTDCCHFFILADTE